MAEGQNKAMEEGQSPPQELEVGPSSKPYFLLIVNMMNQIQYLWLEMCYHVGTKEYNCKYSTASFPSYVFIF